MLILFSDLISISNLGLVSMLILFSNLVSVSEFDLLLIFLSDLIFVLM